MKKLISLVVSFCLSLSVLSFAPFSASAITTYGDYEYTVLSDGTCKLVEYTGENGNKGELIIPSEIDGFTVSTIDDGLLYNCHESYMKITSLVIPGTVKHTSSAFHGCRNLKELIILNGVEVIDNCAFQGAFQLEKIEIPDSVISIGNSVFAHCQITEFRIPKNLKEIPERFLYDCEKITHIDIPNSVVSIGEDAFFGAGLKGVRIPSSVEKIADGAFVRNDENLVIYAHADSVAKDYAAQKGILFKGLKCFCESNRPTEQIIKAVESTCTQKGMSEGKYCTECGEITVKPRETDLLPHKAKWVVIKNSTYFEKGEKVYKCEDCDKILEYKTTAKKRLVTPELNVKADKSAFKVTYKRVKDATGFQVRYRKGNMFVVKTFDKNKKINVTIKNLEKGKYKVSIRSFKQKGKKRVFGNWAKAKAVKIK